MHSIEKIKKINSEAQLEAEGRKLFAVIDKPLQMKRPTDPLIRQMTAAYKASKRYQYDQLMKERAKWTRRETIARNKLTAVESEMDKLLADLLAEAEKGGAK